MSYARSKNLTTYDVLIIASMIEREVAGAEGAQAGRRGDLQPPPRRDAAPDRRDDPLRDRQLHQAAQPVRAPARLAVQHLHQRRAAAGADRQPRPRLDRGGGASGARAATSTTWSSPTPAAEHTFATTEAEFEPGEGRLRPGPRRERAATRRRPRAARADAHGSPSSASRSRTRARRRCTPPRWPSSGSPASGPTRRSRSPPRTSRRGCGRCRARASSAPTSPSRTRSRRSTLADEASEAAREIGAANTLSFADGRIAAENTDASGLPGRAAGAAGRQARAGARRRRLGTRRRLGAGHGTAPRWRSGTAPPEKRRSALAAELGAHGQLHRQPAPVARLRPDRQRDHGGHGRRRAGAAADLKSLPLGADSLGETHQLVDLAYGPAETELARTRESARRNGRRRARGAGSPGRRVASDLDRDGTPDRDDEAGRPIATWQLQDRPGHLRPVPAPGEATARRSSTTADEARDQRRRHRADAPRALGDVRHRRDRRARLRDAGAGRRGDRRGARRRHARRRRCCVEHERDRRRPALARDRRALRPRPRRPQRLQGRHGGGEPALGAAPPAATRRCRSATSTRRRCWSRWPTRPTSSRSTTSR